MLPTLEDLNRWMVVGFDRLYGLEFDALSDREVSAHVRIAEQHKQPMGIVHGGLYATIGRVDRNDRGSRIGRGRGQYRHRSIEQHKLHPPDQPRKRPCRRPTPPHWPHHTGLGRRDLRR
jgi:hypothetical protein